MGLLSEKNRQERVPEYDGEKTTPVVCCSICAGEMVAGFKGYRDTGHFREFGLIRSQEKSWRAFRKSCGVSSVPRRNTDGCQGALFSSDGGYSAS